MNDDPIKTPSNATVSKIKPEDAVRKKLVIQPEVPGATAISMLRRVQDSRFATRYFVGDGLDVGGGNDSLALYRDYFPLTRFIYCYDKDDGDAGQLENVADQSFDFLYSSHCLEHLLEPDKALRNWIRVVRSNGHLVIVVPDEDLYEKGHWPSRFNSDHKVSFTICKAQSWSPVSINVMDLLRPVAALVDILSIARLDNAYRQSLAQYDFDQTRTPMAECGIEMILQRRKLPA